MFSKRKWFIKLTATWQLAGFYGISPSIYAPETVQIQMLCYWSKGCMRPDHSSNAFKFQPYWVFLRSHSLDISKMNLFAMNINYWEIVFFTPSRIWYECHCCCEDKKKSHGNDRRAKNKNQTQFIVWNLLKVKWNRKSTVVDDNWC